MNPAPCSDVIATICRELLNDTQTRTEYVCRYMYIFMCVWISICIIIYIDAVFVLYIFICMYVCIYIYTVCGRCYGRLCTERGTAPVGHSHVLYHKSTQIDFRGLYINSNWSSHTSHTQPTLWWWQQKLRVFWTVVHQPAPASVSW